YEQREITVFHHTNPFVRGDVNNDGRVEGLTDAVRLLNYSFLGGAEPECMEAADANGDGQIVGVVDAIALLIWNFASTTPLTAPFPACGLDPDPTNGLGCGSAPSSCL
ncbi:MAG: dockerin type I repeat-containing protein, partial [Planctomycetota bacterium]